LKTAVNASGSKSVSISQGHGSTDPDPNPDPQQNVMDRNTGFRSPANYPVKACLNSTRVKNEQGTEKFSLNISCIRKMRKIFLV